MSPPLTDKGRARRQAIAEAAADLLLEGGPPVVTHRGVAHRAGVSLGSTTYYFADRDELLAAAVDRARAADVARARAVADQPPAPGSGGLACRLIDVVVGSTRLADPERVAAHYQRFLGTAYGDAGRIGVARWNRELRDAVAETLERHRRDRADADVVLALVDGCALAWLVAGAPDDGPTSIVARVRTAIDHVVAG